MAKTLLLALSAAQLIAACQRDLHDAGLDHHVEGLELVPRQYTSFPPVWTRNEEMLHNSFSAASIEAWSSYYTHGDHMAGRNKSMAEETARKWTENGVSASLVEYHVFLSYPKEQKLVMRLANGTSHEARLFEDVLEEDETTGFQGSRTLPAFHGYSASRKVEAEYVYIG